MHIELILMRQSELPKRSTQPTYSKKSLERLNSLSAACHASLRSFVQRIKRRGVAIVIAHRPSALAGVSKVLVLAKGQMQSFGPKQDVAKPPVPAASAAFLPVRFGRAGDGRVAG